MAALPDASALLAEWSPGNPDALNQLLPLGYAELRRIVARQRRRERTEHTLQPTALVREAYLRLVDQWQVDWHGRAHFFGVAAARVMHRVLVNHARRRAAGKRGDGVEHLPIDAACEPVAAVTVSIPALDQALHRLETLDPGLSAIVEPRAFGGFTLEEGARVLGVSPSAARREIRTTRAWLVHELGWGRPS
jgi:RNA polymerase sigma factor (TIGR02999 family)